MKSRPKLVSVCVTPQGIGTTSASIHEDASLRFAELQAVASLQVVGLFAFDKAQIAFEDPDLLVDKEVALARHGNTSTSWELTSISCSITLAPGETARRR